MSTGFGLIGHPLAHSFSREVHEALCRYSFELIDVKSDEMCKLLRHREFSGLCVTRPYKRDVMSFCDRLTTRAESIGAVNTLYFDGPLLIGHNTDYDGFSYMAGSAGVSFKDKVTLVLGTGGASRTVRAVLSDEGAKRIYTATRFPGEHRDEDGFISYGDIPDISSSVDIVVNATPCGTYPDNKGKPVELSGFSSCEAVLDVVYNPRRTRLLMEAETLGMKTSDGLPMLVAQAMAAAECFTGEEGCMDETPRILDDLRRKMENIVLIGMPGSGKTTLGRWISERTGRPFIDIDEEIERSEGKSVPAIFDEGGEELFRRLEALECEKAGALSGHVIAAGGGVCVTPENFEALYQNGTIIWLKRPLCELSGEGRPLSSSPEAVAALYESRKDLYEEWSEVSGDMEEIKAFVKERYRL